MNFKALIANSNKTQKDLASKVGVTQQLVSKWATGKCQPQLSYLKRIAEALNVAVSDVLDCFKQQTDIKNTAQGEQGIVDEGTIETFGEDEENDD